MRLEMIPVEQLYWGSILTGTPEVQSKAAKPFYGKVKKIEIAIRCCIGRYLV
jgi:hypothetical protein